MSEAPERMWIDPDILPSEWDKRYHCDVEYVRADRIEELEARVAELEAAIKATLDREAAAYSRHDARVAELEAALVEDDEEQAKWVEGLTDDWIAAEARAEAAEDLLSEAVKAVEQEMLRVCNEYSKKGNMAAATAIHDTWLCVQTALAAIQEGRG